MTEQKFVSLVVDPVCGMTVNPSNAAANHTYQGETYYFCNLGCAEKFRADPERYLKSKESTPPTVAATKSEGQVRLVFQPAPER